MPSAMIFYPFLIEVKQLFNNSYMRLYCQPRLVPRCSAGCAAKCHPAGGVIRRPCYDQNWIRL